MGPMEEDLLVPWKSLTVFQNSLLDLASENSSKLILLFYYSLTFSFLIIRGRPCSFGTEILVRNQLIFFTDFGGGRVHVIDVTKRKVNNRLLDSLILRSH